MKRLKIIKKIINHVNIAQKEEVEAKIKVEIKVEIEAEAEVEVEISLEVQDQEDQILVVVDLKEDQNILNPINKFNFKLLFATILFSNSLLSINSFCKISE